MESTKSIRPVIFDYGEIHHYVRDMLHWRRTAESDFSVRKVTKILGNCSPTLVTQVSKGQREITRERVEDFCHILALTPQEKAYLDQWVVRHKRETNFRRTARTERPWDKEPVTTSFRNRSPSNHLLNDWVNVYVKDACRLRDFQPNPKIIYRLLGGIVPLKRIKKSLNFLFKEGFLRKTLEGRVVESSPVTATTDDVPDKKIRTFHKRALDVAKRGIDLFPLSERRASAVVLPVDADNLDKLRDLLCEFHERITGFAEEHPNDSERLYQIVINFCPIGGRLNVREILKEDLP